MTSASVIETIRYQPSDYHAPTVFFYCENDHTETLRASSALSSLIRQLGEFLHRNAGPWPAHLRKEIVTFFGRRKITPDFNDLQNIFIQLFDLVPMATYVLDGLDAMEEEQCKLLLTFIRSLFSGARELKGQRILLFSRDQIPGYVNLATLIPGIGRISTFDNTMSDIRTFIDYSISDKSMYRKLTDDRLLLEETKDVLLNESSGMFLWVHLQLEILWSTCFTDAEVRSALRQLPKDLEETYRYCANRINTHDTRALKVLKWVGFASRPLHLEELREATQLISASDSPILRLNKMVLLAFRAPSMNTASTKNRESLTAENSALRISASPISAFSLSTNAMQRERQWSQALYYLQARH
ncbi:hypothetical protein BP00DRAFT_165650 [Aspergillus indologenus CBS 114.80]|uniref:Nephrocystin 3-like N-terminal domain-containing protein n=1 Tax=Aspergillus indologenus CBS 114.80 TaxID=1450541 RepID=A0A2V5I559_9EURO|nr:hypothetical protein BP00DRAFT_165650 [Aspergillus indologenus CBS 114.80]